MADTATITKDTEEMRRMRLIKWVDPKKAHGGPTLNVKGAKKLLGYKNVGSIYIHTRRGPEQGGFPGYIPSPNGDGWIRRSDAANGIEVMYYKEDLEAWAKANQVKPEVKPKPELLRYTPDERDYILFMAEQTKANGYVYRKHLQKRLQGIDYVCVQFADGRPDATGWLIPSSPDVAILFVNVSEQVTVLLPAVDIVTIRKGNSVWDSRHYPKVKKILDDAGIPLAPIPRRREDTAS